MNILKEGKQYMIGKYFFFLNRILCYSAGFQLQSQTYSAAAAFSLPSQVVTQPKKNSKDSQTVLLCLAHTSNYYECLKQ